MSDDVAAVGFPVAAMVLHGCRLLYEKIEKPQNCSGIVVGCGSGDEVIFLRRAFRSRRIFGVDVESRFSPRARVEGAVITGDALGLPFPGASFDFAAAFHSLEHVANPPKALEEISRVLRRGAWFYVGVPNRTRILGYAGSFDASWSQKVYWNLKDWRARLLGRFRNEAGAHAGFDRDELTRLLAGCFTDVQIVTEEFLRFKYASRLPGLILDVLLSPALINYSAPAHYALCRNVART